MNISTRNHDEILAIDLDGRLDSHTSIPALKELMQYMESGPNKVLVNLAALEFVSSAGLRVILRVAKQVHGYGGQLKVSGAKGVVKEVLEITGFDTLLNLYEDEERAVGSFQ